jgi:hypothetical protein
MNTVNLFSTQTNLAVLVSITPARPKLTYSTSGCATSCLFRGKEWGLEQGWVYLLVNPSIPGLVKIGQTTGLPIDRAAELSRPTGVATPFVLVFEQAFSDCAAAERDIHAILDRCGMRHKPNREFFRGPIPEIIRLVLLYAQETGDGVMSASKLCGTDLLQQGDRYLFGEADTLQDVPEALRCYQMAIKRGSVIAFERLGAIIAQVQGAERGGKARAMGYLKEGARRGNYYCYCELAAIAAQEGHVANFMKAWDFFFSCRSTGFMIEAEAGKDRYIVALQRYVVTCFTLGILPTHIEELSLEAEALVQHLKVTHETVRHLRGERRTLAVPLRWCYRTLLGRPYPGDAVRQFWSWLPRWTDRRHSATA